VSLDLDQFLAVAAELRCLASGSLLLLSGRGQGQGAGDPALQQQLGAALKECARVLASVGLLEQRVLGSQAVYAAVLAETDALVGSLPGRGHGEGDAEEESVDPASTSGGAAVRSGGGPMADDTAVEQLLHGTGSGAIEDVAGSRRHVSMLQLQRLRQEGYHPDFDGASFSVILTREEKLQHVASLR
jgi:hypothetical protein